MPFNPFSALTSKIFGGVAVLAIVFASIQTWRVGNLKDDVAGYKANQVINLASIEELEMAIDKCGQSIENAKKIQNQKKKDAEVALSEAKQQSRDLQDQIDAIASERQTSQGFDRSACKTPEIILNTEGL